MRIAAIDIGTNSMHLEVAEVDPKGAIRVVEKQREQVELGAGEFAAKAAPGHLRLTPDAMARGLAAMRRFRTVCDGYDVEDIHAAATSAVREAENGGDFVRDVKSETGIHVKVVSGLDEARLVWLGARADIDFSTGRALIFDLGGGSTEFVLCDSANALVMESLALGHIRLTEAFVRADPLTESDRKALKEHVRKLMEPLLQRVRPNDFRTLVGTSGTARALARLATRRRGDPDPEREGGMLLHRDELESLIRVFREQSSAQWANLPGMDPRRVRTLPAGAVLVREVMKATGKEVLQTSERSLRDGLVVDWILQHRPELDIAKTVPDPRRRAVVAAMHRFNADEAHASRIAATATHLFDATAPLHEFSPTDRRLLEFGAMLHDIGHHIAGEDHHRHGQYLVRHARMPGFTAPEIAVLGCLVRYHRGGRPKNRDDDYGSLSNADRRKVRIMSSMIRLADAFDRGHDGNITAVRASLADGVLQIRATSRDGGELERWAANDRSWLLAEELALAIQIDVERA